MPSQEKVRMVYCDNLKFKFVITFSVKGKYRGYWHCSPETVPQYFKEGEAYGEGPGLDSHDISRLRKRGYTKILCPAEFFDYDDYIS